MKGTGNESESSNYAKIRKEERLEIADKLLHLHAHLRPRVIDARKPFPRRYCDAVIETEPMAEHGVDCGLSEPRSLDRSPLQRNLVQVA